MDPSLQPAATWCLFDESCSICGQDDYVPGQEQNARTMLPCECCHVSSHKASWLLACLLPGCHFFLATVIRCLVLAWALMFSTQAFMRRA